MLINKSYDLILNLLRDFKVNVIENKHNDNVVSSDIIYVNKIYV